VDASAVDYATPGSYSAMVTATKDGSSSDPIAVTVTVVPVLAITTTSASVSLTGPEADSAHVLSGLGASINVPGTLSVDLSALDRDTAGRYPVTLSASDGYGFTATATATVVITATDQPPVITTTLAPAAPDGSSGWYVSTPTVAASATDDSGVAPTLEEQLGDGTWAPYAGPLTATAGTSTFTFRATDAKGHVATTSVPVRVDLVAPTTTASRSVTADPNGPVTVTLSATDDHSGVASTAYRIGDGGWRAYSTAFTVSPVSGEQSVSYRSTDVAGNVEVAGTLVIGAADTQPPALSLATTPGGPDGLNGWYVSRPTIAATAVDVITAHPTIEYRVGTGAWAAYGGGLQAPDGTTTYEFRATDAAGNVATRTIAVSVDTGRPTAQAQRQVAKRKHHKPVAWRVRLTAGDAVSGVATIRYRIGGGSWHAYSAPVVVKAKRKKTTLTYQAIDRAGQVGVTHQVKVPKKRR
jgi:hypothetical protein